MISKMTPYKKPKLNQKRNLGVCWGRAEYDLGDGRVNPEKAFQEAWDNQNTPNCTTRFGTGQDIFVVSKSSADNFVLISFFIFLKYNVGVNLLVIRPPFYVCKPLMYS